MIKISIDSRELNRFMKDIDKFSESKQQAIKHEIARATYEIQDTAKREVPVDKGILKNSIDAVIVNKELTGQVIVKRNYGIFVHEGTKPHIIRPVRKKVLAWRVRTQGKLGKDYVFAKVVNHPGTKPNPFLLRAVNKQRPIYQQNLINILSEGTK